MLIFTFDPLFQKEMGLFMDAYNPSFLFQKEVWQNMKKDLTISLLLPLQLAIAPIFVWC